jgi:EsV-1-7 cysteine-rich motif
VFTMFIRLRSQVPRYCARHAADKEHVVHLDAAVYCVAAGCLKRYAFVLKHDRQAKYCTQHALEHSAADLIVVRGGICEAELCRTRPIYGFSVDKIARRCKSHILPGMVDVKHKVCEGCNKRIDKGYKFDNDKVSFSCSVRLFMLHVTHCTRTTRACVLAAYREYGGAVSAGLRAHSQGDCVK